MGDPVFLNIGDSAPFTGLLFSESLSEQIRRELLEGDKSKVLLENERSRTTTLSQIIQLKDEEIELYQKQNTRLLKTNDRSDTMNYIWFGLGILVTGAAIYGAGSLAK